MVLRHASYDTTHVGCARRSRQRACTGHVLRQKLGAPRRRGAAGALRIPRRWHAAAKRLAGEGGLAMPHDSRLVQSPYGWGRTRMGRWGGRMARAAMALPSWRAHVHPSRQKSTRKRIGRWRAGPSSGLALETRSVKLALKKCSSKYGNNKCRAPQRWLNAAMTTRLLRTTVLVPPRGRKKTPEPTAVEKAGGRILGGSHCAEDKHAQP